MIFDPVGRVFAQEQKNETRPADFDLFGRLNYGHNVRGPVLPLLIGKGFGLAIAEAAGKHLTS